MLAVRLGALAPPIEGRPTPPREVLRVADDVVGAFSLLLPGAGSDWRGPVDELEEPIDVRDDDMSSRGFTWDWRRKIPIANGNPNIKRQ